MTVQIRLEIRLEFLLNEIEYCANNALRIEKEGSLRARTFVASLAGTLIGMAAHDPSELGRRLDELGTLVFSMLKEGDRS